MTFDYITVPEGINVDADIYPLRVGREDERVLYGIDPAFIVEACMERRSALGYSNVYKYVLGRAIRRKVPSTSGGEIDFLTCIEKIRDINRSNLIVGGWLNRDFTFADVSELVNYEGRNYLDLEDAYPGSTITDWASPVEHSNRIIGLDELKACYHDIARMSRMLMNRTVKHSAYTEVISGTDTNGDHFRKEIEEKEGYGFATAYNYNVGTDFVASGLYFMVSWDPLSTSYQPYYSEGLADPVYSFEGVDKYKAATALFLLETMERNTYTNRRYYYEIIARPVGKDGSVSFDNATAKSICLSHRSLQPVKDQAYVIEINCLDACLAVDLDLKTDISDIKWE